MSRRDIHYWKCDRPAAFHGTGSALRVDEVARVADEVMAARASDRVGEMVRVIVASGTTEYQGPEDGSTRLLGEAAGQVVDARIVDTDGADLVAEVVHD